MKKAESVKYYIAASVAVAAFIIYLSALKNDFIFWDDDLYIFQNSHIQSLNAAFFKWAFFDFHAGNWHPLTWISHALDYAIWGLNPLGHHLTNNVLHAANTFLVVLVVWRLLEAYRAVIPAKAGIQRFFSSANPPGRGKVTGFRVKPGMTKVRKDSRLGESPGVIGQAGMTENGNLLRNGGTVPSPLGNNLKISPNPCLSDRQAS